MKTIFGFLRSNVPVSFAYYLVIVGDRCTWDVFRAHWVDEEPAAGYDRSCAAFPDHYRLVGLPAASIYNIYRDISFTNRRDTLLNFQIQL